MTTFFEKLKKGMEVEELPEKEPVEVEEEISEKKKPKKKSVKREKIIGKTVEEKEEFKKIKETPWLTPEGQLVVDIYQTDKEIVIQTAIAGVGPEDLDISTENDMIIIKGVRKKPSEEEDRNYFYQECYWGPFSREIILPEEADASRIQSTMKQGILTIRIPKIKRRANRKIIVE